MCCSLCRLDSPGVFRTAACPVRQERDWLYLPNRYPAIPFGQCGSEGEQSLVGAAWHRGGCKAGASMAHCWLQSIMSCHEKTRLLTARASLTVCIIRVRHPPARCLRMQRRCMAVLSQAQCLCSKKGSFLCERCSDIRQSFIHSFSSGSGSLCGFNNAHRMHSQHLSEIFTFFS